MNHYILEEHKLVLKTKKSPFFVLFSLYIITILCIILPVLALVYSFGLGDGIKLTHIIMLGFFGLMFFYMLRLSLWNTMGFERLTFNEISIHYVADYGWFKDSQKTFDKNKVVFEIVKVGYDDENLGVLVVHCDTEVFHTASKLPISELKLILSEIEKWN
jgi:hypothetical protein